MNKFLNMKFNVREYKKINIRREIRRCESIKQPIYMFNNSKFKFVALPSNCPVFSQLPNYELTNEQLNIN